MSEIDDKTTGMPLLTCDARTWQPVPNAVTTPLDGVTLHDDGLFRLAMDRHTSYLLTDANVDDMVWRFRKLAGVADPPGEERGWERMFPAHAAQFLIGAGNTLRWGEQSELRTRMNTLIDAIKACRTTDGLLAAPYGSGEEGYSFMLLAHGLVAAASVGHPDAYDLLASWARWYRLRVEEATADNPRSILDFDAEHHSQNYFAVTACMLAYFTPDGTPEDVLTAYQHVLPEWIDVLAARKLEAIWSMPIHPHSAYCYGWLGMLDIYRATGDRRLLDAMQGGWELYRRHWQHPGGTLAICEGGIYPPDTLYLTPMAHTGETCSMVWWARFNHILHQLYPANERYIAEIEKVIYNVGLANQVDGSICYHTNLEGERKAENPYTEEASLIAHTCCEVVGSYLYATLPQYIYSLADDGVYVNLYEPSSITCNIAGQQLHLTMSSRFPFYPEVKLHIHAEQSVRMTLRVRTPGWASTDMPISVNGETVACGQPGIYVALERTWNDGDTVEFVLPMDFRVTGYEGGDQIGEHHRFAILYGPVLMAAVGPLGEEVQLPDFVGKPNHTYLVRIAHDPANPHEWLQSIPNIPLNFAIQGHEHLCLMPYWLANGAFTCYPVIEPM